MISLDRRTIKKGGCTPACSHRQNYPPPSPPHTHRGYRGRLTHCNLSDLQNSMEIASCNLKHIFSLKAILHAALVQ